jgi:glutathione peroxidase
MSVTEIASKSIYKYKVKDLLNNEIPLDLYKDKVLLIVNTASNCDYTGQYNELEEIYKKYHKMGFEVLAFPSNDFGNQEPLSGIQIQNFCHTKFKTSFKIFNKIKVKGLGASPLFQFLSEKKLNGKINMYPKWNFHKYLVNRNGEVVDYFFTITKPNSPKILYAIEKLL